MANLYKIETKENILSVNWILSNVCNYKCSYCSEFSNRGDLLWPDIKQCEILVNSITEQSTHDYRIYTLLGGEPTVWKDFTKFIEMIKGIDNNSVINILTNGSRTIKWWNRTKFYLDKVSISFHHESADVNHIIEVVNTIQLDCQTNIQLLMDINAWNKCVDIYYQLKDNTTVPIYLKKLQIEFGKKEWMPYTDEQIEWIKNSQKELFLEKRKSLKTNKASLGIKCYYDNGSITNETNHDLIQSNKNKFKGWACNIGKDCIVIKDNGKIYPANSCNNEIILGNIKEDSSNIKLLQKPIICNYNECTCGNDIEISKTYLS